MARPFHFTTDPVADGDWSDFVSTSVRNQSGTNLNVTRATAGEVGIIRDTDASNNSDVRMRARRNGNCEFGLVSNFQDNSNYYLYFNQQSFGRHAIFKKVGGTFTTLGVYNVDSVDGVYEIMQGTSQDEGGDKRLKFFIDGIERVNVLAGNQFGSGQAGIRLFPFGVLGDMDVDWWTFDTSISVTGVVPSAGTEEGGTSVTITGSDIGDGSLAEFDGTNAVGNVATPNTQLDCVTPPHAPGLVVVKVKFGTLGSEEFIGSLVAGYTYTAIPVDIPEPVVVPEVRAVFMGVDITRFVSSWGRLEQIKDILLAQATLLTTEMTLEVLNFRKFMNPKGPGSLIAGLDHYNGLLEILKDGRTIYEGLVDDIRPNANSQTATMVSENILKKPAETVINTQATGANPALAMLGFIQLAVEDSQIDARTFNQAAAPSGQAGATIDYAFLEGDNITVLQAIQLVSNLASISVFVKDNVIIARPFIPYEGGEANFKQELNDAIVRQWGAYSWDNSAFNNRVSVGFPVDKFVLLEDVESIKENGRTPRLIEFPADEKVVASNLTSADFFGKLYLRRAAKRRTKLNVAGGKALDGTVIGDRFPVTTPSLGLIREPMECIEVSQTLDSDEIELGLARIFES